MTDYLEELLDQAGALVEQVRRMEQSRPGLVLAEKTEKSGLAPAERRETGLEKSEVLRPLERTLFRTGRRGAQRVPDAETGEWGVLPDWEEMPALKTVPGQEAVFSFSSGGTALLDQLKLLERAVSAPGGHSSGTAARTGRSGGGSADWAPLSGGAFPNVNAVPASGWPGGTGLRESVGPAGELGWVEEADRVFRRDSRRYDGGFYLY